MEQVLKIIVLSHASRVINRVLVFVFWKQQNHACAPPDLRYLLHQGVLVQGEDADLKTSQK